MGAKGHNLSDGMSLQELNRATELSYPVGLKKSVNQELADMTWGKVKWRIRNPPPPKKKKKIERQAVFESVQSDRLLRWSVKQTEGLACVRLNSDSVLIADRQNFSFGSLCCPVLASPGGHTHAHVR